MFFQRWPIQYGSGRDVRRAPPSPSSSSEPSAADDDDNDVEEREIEVEEEEEEGEDDPADFFTITGVWERGGSRSRNTLTETIEVRFHDWERARRPDLLLPRCIERLLNTVLAGRAQPLRVGIGLQPPGWDNCFHIPMRPPQQNTPWALAAAIEDFAKNYDALDIFSSDVRIKVAAIWPIGKK